VTVRRSSSSRRAPRAFSWIYKKDSDEPVVLEKRWLLELNKLPTELTNIKSIYYVDDIGDQPDLQAGSDQRKSDGLLIL
jgi:hypothetical protein